MFHPRRGRLMPKIADLQHDNATMLSAGRTLVEYLLALGEGRRPPQAKTIKAALVFMEGEGLRGQMRTEHHYRLITADD